ncbi:nucleoside permease [Edaphobacter dinghuensis]|uniref:MFS transporter n=1 Tax=Edaphobacter dinghuensis TaxID=1560005 RepID=A0A917H8Q6_9BACT|nr:nucleoside permease [Edaphobacter dinghuensis]GGG71114.1 MFS transporter [Edaphobacter dinghuensis]
MKLQLRTRLSTMMFLEYFIWGAWYVTLGTWLAGSLHFTGQQIGLAAGTTAVGAIIAPFFVGIVADRFFATQKVLGFLHIIGAILLFVASIQASFTAFYVLILLYCLAFMPTLSLANSLAFRQMDDPKEEFGAIRVLGSGGWIVAGLLIGTMRLEATSTPMRLAALASLLMGLYSFTLPATPPLARTEKFSLDSIFPREAIKLLGERSMLIFVIASFLICIPLQFYYAFTNLFLNQTGVSNAAGKMTGGQMSELICMLLIPWFFRRLGVKYMLIAGMLAWVARYLLFAYGNVNAHMWMLWGGILLHGICYDFFFVTGQIYIDRKAPLNLRAAAQGIIIFITYGLGMFVGSWLSGAVVSHYALAAPVGMATYDWKSIWMFSAGASAVVLILFLFTFSDKGEDPKPLPAENADSLQVPI